MRRSQVLLRTDARRACADGTAAELRRAARATNAEWAAVIGVSEPTISRWLSGQRVPQGAAAERLGRLLEATRHQLEALDSFGDGPDAA